MIAVLLRFRKEGKRGMRTEIKISGLQIETDGRTVWINSNKGMCVGRFSAHGVDVHADYEAQLQGVHCLDCCHDLPFDESWERFKSSMQTHYLIAIGDEFKPRDPSAHYSRHRAPARSKPF